MCKNITKVVILLLAVLMIVSTPAFAMDMRASSRIISSSARVRSGDDSNLWVYFSITASSTMDNIGASKIVIQRYSDSHWVPECVLTSEDFPEIQASDVSRHSTSISYEPMYSGYKPSSGFSLRIGQFWHKLNECDLKAHNDVKVLVYYF